VDNGLPQTNRRVATRPAGQGAAAAAKVKSGTANRAAPSGPVDPRTEDASSPFGLVRPAKTYRRRPGMSRPAIPAEITTSEPPVDFAVALPLATAADTMFAETVAAPADSPPADLPTALLPSADLAADSPTALLPSADLAADLPTALVPTTLVPTEIIPTPAVADNTTALIEQAPPILYDEAATIDDVTQIGPVLETRPLRTPIRIRRQPKPRIRRVTRIVRHVDTWSVFKVAVLFSLFFYAVALVAGVLLWQVAYATGTIDNVEKFFEGFGWETFKFDGGQIFHNAWIAGLFLSIGFTGLAVLMATLFNLITDLVGGIRLSVLEEEVMTRVHRGTEPAPSVPIAVDAPLVETPDESASGWIAADDTSQMSR
jgi:hypothetical protein